MGDHVVPISPTLRQRLIDFQATHPLVPGAPAGYYTEAYRAVYAELHGQMSDEQDFWLRQATGINGADNLANILIRSQTVIGSALVGNDMTNSEVQDASNTIAYHFVSDVLANNGMPTLRTIIENDAGSALATGYVAGLEGWGGIE